MISKPLSREQVEEQIRNSRDKNFTPTCSFFQLGRQALAKGVVPPLKVHPEILEGFNFYKAKQ